MVLNNFVLSANAGMLLDATVPGKSFAKSRNSIGPRIEPWGTPDVTGHFFILLDVTPGSVTC